MHFLAQLADEALNCLKEKKYSLLADLMDKNFSLRRKLYTDEVVGGRNIAAVDLANKLGLSAKFTGSGGALVCLRRDLDDWFYI
jgi:glucuronokinase